MLLRLEILKVLPEYSLENSYHKYFQVWEWIDLKNSYYCINNYCIILHELDYFINLSSKV